MKKIMYVSTYENYTRMGVLNKLRAKGIRYEKQQNLAIVTDEITYYFFNMNQKRNIRAFVKKHKNVEMIAIDHEQTIDRLFDNIEKDLFYSLINHDKTKIESIGNSHEMLLKHHSAFKIIEVYQLWGNSEIKKKTLLEGEYIGLNTYKTEEEAKNEIIRQAKMRIQRLESNLKRERQIVEKFS